MVTLLEALTRAGVAVNSDSTRKGPNTTVNTGLNFRDWEPWPDFDYATLTRIFRRELGQEYRGELQPRPVRHDLDIYNEESFDDVLRRFVNPIVNYALEEQTGSCHYGRGTRCSDAQYKPDWSVVSDQRVDGNGQFINMLPGDTKLDAKWRPEMVGEPRDQEEWEKVIAQITTYMTHHYSRYGFIITDTVLVVLRITRRELDDGISGTLPRRAAGVAAAAALASHARHSSDVSMTSGSGSTYVDNDPLKWAYYNPEYAIVPWSAHGRGRLTIKLALWCLAMMAAGGDSSINYWYPPLDSWRIAEDSGGYIHNTSGARKNRLSETDQFYDISHPGEPAGGEGASGDHQSSAATWEGSEDTADPGYYGNPAGPSSASHEALHFSQASSPFASGELSRGLEAQEGYAGVGGDDYEENQGTGGGDGNDDDDDDRTEVGTAAKRVTVTVKKHTISRQSYFVDYKGNQRDTSKDEWRKVPGGYELSGRKHVYFTKRFP